MDKLSLKDTPIKATCHCGKISATVPGQPPERRINECQCTICRRYGAAWAYYNVNDVKFENEGDAKTRKYVWGDREIEFHFCENCGCMVYWYPIEIPEGGCETGINARMMEPDAMKGVDREITFSALCA